jgi:cell division protein FtsB
MRVLAFALAALIVLIQAPLWLGKGGWLRAGQIENDLSRQKEKNSRLEARNAAFAAEVRDLKQGTEAVEERARYELGMIRNDEIFFQIIEKENNGQINRPQSSQPQAQAADQEKAAAAK